MMGSVQWVMMAAGAMLVVVTEAGAVTETGAVAIDRALVWDELSIRRRTAVNRKAVG